MISTPYHRVLPPHGHSTPYSAYATCSASALVVKPHHWSRASKVCRAPSCCPWYPIFERFSILRLRTSLQRTTGLRNASYTKGTFAFGSVIIPYWRATRLAGERQAGGCYDATRVALCQRFYDERRPRLSCGGTTNKTSSLRRKCCRAQVEPRC